MKFIDQPHGKIIEGFLVLYGAYIKDMNLTKFTEAVLAIETYENHNDPEIIHESPFVKKWYRSLEKGEPDYSVYEGEYYMASSILCYANYTRNMLKVLDKHRDVWGNKKIKSVIDYGCGIGYSTIVLSEMFPKALVYGTNYKPSHQLDFTKKLFRNYENITALPSGEKLGHIDLAFAAEYFEHFKEPITELNRLLDQNSPSVLVTANSFAPIAVGHFNIYNIVGVGQDQNARKTTAEFNKVLKNRGYKKYSEWWNGRPNIWVKEK